MRSEEDDKEEENLSKRWCLNDIDQVKVYMIEEGSWKMQKQNLAFGQEQCVGAGFQPSSGVQLSKCR